MTPSRVYKVKIRENILRQMIFTDMNILIGVIAVITALIWFLGRRLPAQIKVFATIIVSGFLILGLTAKIDGQPSYKILVRAIPFSLRKKTIRF